VSERMKYEEQLIRKRLVCAAPFSLHNKIYRVLWKAVWLFLFCPTPQPSHAWRCLLLRAFVAKLGGGPSLSFRPNLGALEGPDTRWLPLSALCGLGVLIRRRPDAAMTLATSA